MTTDSDTQPEADRPVDDEPAAAVTAQDGKRGVSWLRICAYIVVPVVVLLLTLGAGYLVWMDGRATAVEQARTEAVQVASDGTVAMLSYESATVEEQLAAARDRLTGDFKDSYTSLTDEVVIPGAKEQQISSVATVPAAAVVSATTDSAVVLVYINQTTEVGEDPPTNLTSTARVTLDKVDGQWLISQFEPV
ncbi:hypothetical protein [Mycolicibacterium thermoresistibile]